jgi:hypothetical protein
VIFQYYPKWLPKKEESTMKNCSRIFEGLPALVAVFGLGCLSAYGQGYTIQSAEYPQIGVKNILLADTSGHVPVVIGGGGENMTWEFKQELKGREIPYEFVTTAETPYPASAPALGSEWAVRSKQWLDVDPNTLLPNGLRGFFDVYYYQKLDHALNAVIGVGIGAGIITSSLVCTGGYPYTNLSTDFPFPLSLHKTWQRKTEISAPATYYYLPTLPIPITMVQNDNSNMEVDATGRLTLPSGSYDCLRIKSIRNLVINAFLGTTPVPVSNDTIIMYEWWAKNVGLLLQVSSHAAEKNPDFTESGYVARLVSTNASTGIGCLPDCRPAGLLPSGCSLSQNFPNPFNPSTSVQYRLSEPSRVEFKVFSLLGKEIAVLDAGAKPAGDHTVVWNGKDQSGNRLPSGMYLYRLKAVPFSHGHAVVLTKKMIMTD